MILWSSANLYYVYHYSPPWKVQIQRQLQFRYAQLDLEQSWRVNTEKMTMAMSELFTASELWGLSGNCKILSIQQWCIPGVTAHHPQSE